MVVGQVEEEGLAANSLELGRECYQIHRLHTRDTMSIFCVEVHSSCLEIDVGAVRVSIIVERLMSASQMHCQVA